MERGPLSPTEFSSAVTAITAAFGDPTRREIYLFVRDADHGVTAGEVAERFELHPNVARHHLDKLAAGGYLHLPGERLGHSRGRRPAQRHPTPAQQTRPEVPA